MENGRDREGEWRGPAGGKQTAMENLSQTDQKVVISVVMMIKSNAGAVRRLPLRRRPGASPCESIAW